MIYRIFSFRRCAWGMTALCMLSMLNGRLDAACPPAPKLLPENTIFLISTPNARELETKFFNTGLGRMLQDPHLKPLVDRLRSDLAQAVASIKSEVGLSLDEMLDLYQGQITFALIDLKSLDKPPVAALLLDAGDKIPLARRLTQKGMAILEQTRSPKREETFGGVKLTIFEGLPTGRPEVVFFEKDNTAVITTGLGAAKEMLSAWDGKNKKTLSGNSNFATVMSRCRGSRDETPQIIFYCDTQNLFKSVGASGGRGAIFTAMMPALGLDGLLGFGGSVLFDESRFDSVLHLHIILENPRSGVLKVIAFRPGPSKPEYWIPADAVKYTTFHWDFPKSLQALTKVVDGYLGEGTVKRFLSGQIKQQWDVDLQEALDALEGRIITFSWFQRPITEQSGQSVMAVKLKDVKKIERFLAQFAQRRPNEMIKVSYAGKTYYRNPNPPDPRRPLDHVCFGILDDYLVIGSLPPIYEKTLLTAAEGKTSLADEPDFKLVMSKIQRVSSDVPPALITFERDDESLRYLYELAQSERVRKGLQRGAEGNNRFLKSINSALESHPLPPFETLRQYLSPSGTIITDDETGIHYMNFGLKRKPE
jgi:hypothetical protein